MNTMTHKGYAARVEYSEEDGCFVGHIAGIREVIGFHGESVAELRAAFEDAVDDYLETSPALQRVASSAAIRAMSCPFWFRKIWRHRARAFLSNYRRR